MSLILVNKPFILLIPIIEIIKHLYGQQDDVYRLIPLVSELAKARLDTGTILVCIRHPTDRISV